MKLLFFSSDRAEVELVWSALVGSGIDCEVRDKGTALWIEKGRDYHKASVLCRQLGVGFARHPVKAPWLDGDWQV